MSERVRMGMVGGAEGAFIGAIHRMAAALDGGIELVAGCFSSDPSRGRATAAKLGLPADRSYASYRDLVLGEAARPAGERMEFVSVVTPNDLHLPVAIEALQGGFHVLSDKPAARSLEEALSLRASVEQSGLVYGLTHTYAAYPMVRQAREMVLDGELGAVRRVTVSYPQGWLASAADTGGSKQASWRTDPARSGESGCFGDIGTHAHNLVEYVTGSRITEVCADLRSLVEGRLLDDDGAALFKLENSARGTLTASQVCAGEGNNLNISIYCEKGALLWQQEDPNRLQVRRRGRPLETYQAGTDCAYLAEGARALCRTPVGHPEGYIEAFANIYRDFAARVLAHREGSLAAASDIEAGVRGMAFVRAAIESSRNHSSWVSLRPLWEEPATQ
ncbi:Gfo/Idh/MocA family protein [Microbulbifer taiwanensis]|uniref:Gfo/Idh/MocA family protein n=1 Tax=Microbulbifer taiwanensis TaxID=986746 RepID=A0ABW1YW70_9GAMM|nr:Gfo/Idh/MocA family oxidoreductase [Microbulbifer taiwanensis]